jgi:hypothetical protein
MAAVDIVARRQRMSRKSGNRFSDKDMRKLKESGAHPDPIGMRSRSLPEGAVV